MFQWIKYYRNHPLRLQRQCNVTWLRGHGTIPVAQTHTHSHTYFTYHHQPDVYCMSVDCFCDMVQRCSIYPIRTTHSVSTHTCTHTSSSAQCSVYRAPRTIHGRSGVTHMFLHLQWPTWTVLSIISMQTIRRWSTFTETQCSIFLSLSFEIRLQVEKRKFFFFFAKWTPVQQAFTVCFCVSGLKW